MPREKKIQNKPIQAAQKTKKNSKTRSVFGRSAFSRLSRVEPMLPGGFRDYGPADAIERARMLGVVRNTFETFGFDPMETASIQRKEVLFGGEQESEKIVFETKGSREKTSDTALRFDLTVPFARFMAANPEIPKPFKRYQIGTVWRGESPQAGRYREFMQADIDIVGSSSLDADAEVIAAIYWTLKNMGIDDFVIKINSRKVFSELLQEPGFDNNQIKNLDEIIREIDKEPKIGLDAVRKNITGFAGRDTAEAVMAFLQKPVTDPDLLEIKKIAQDCGVENIVIDKKIARGLSYYTGMVFETFLTKAPEMGSIASGGRYDELIAPFTGQKIPAVGASIGIDRLFAAREKLGMAEKKATLTKALVLNLSSELKSDYLSIVKQLRDAEIPTSFYLGDDTSFQAQLSYAVKKEIPFVVIYGDKEKQSGNVAVKNLMTREQKEMPIAELTGFFKQ